MRTCALIGAVDFNAEHFKAQSFDYLIAVDSGYKHLEELGFVPDFIIGDFDSLGFVPDHPCVERHPSHKDESDIEIALKRAVEKGYDNLIVYGCLGGRLDFTYAVYQLIVRFAEAGNQVFAIGKDVVVTSLVGVHKNSISFTSAAKGTLSLFAVSEEVLGVDEVGLEYTLEKAILRYDTPLGVSNAFCGKESQVSIEQGTALLFFPVDAWACQILRSPLA